MSSNTEFDSPWKSIIELYFRQFIGFYFPTIETDIDWTHPPQFLDQELQKIVRDGETGKRYADKLVQVRTLDGTDALVICHIEVQSQQEQQFPKRMLTYNYRLRDRYDCSVASLAILGDDTPTWRPTTFHDTRWGCSIAFEFPIVKLLDYSEDNLLDHYDNPFAIVTLAHLKTKETHNNPESRKTWKFRLTTMLYDRGYGRQDILELYNFLDYMMALPESLSKQFDLELEAFEETKRMKYITTIERQAEARGIELGEARGIELGEARGIELGSSRKARSLIQRQLTHRFGNLPAILITKIDKLTLDQIDQLSEALLDFSRLQDLEQWVEQHQPEDPSQT
jgi:Domain of unknown function (DUF4351)